MEKKRLVSVDEWSGGVTTFEYDDLTDKAVINTTTNVGPIIEENKRLQNEEQREIPGLGKRVAQIPPAVQMLWYEMYGVEAWRYSSDPDIKKFVNRLLMSNEWRFLRTNDWCF